MLRSQEPVCLTDRPSDDISDCHLNKYHNYTLPDITETDQERLKEIIWKERRCELAMEGWRRDDLMRQKRFGTVMRAYATKYNTSKGANFRDDRDYLFPIPQGERDKSNNILSQNPGF